MTDTLATCPRDGFPLIYVNGGWECAAEYLDRCLGQQPIADIVQRGGTVYYLFENGHELPMLCFCCGTPLVYGDIDRTRRDMQGRRLESMSCDIVTTQAGREAVEYRLEFSKKGLLRPGVRVAIALQAAAKLRHPSYCPHRDKVSTPASQRKRRRK
ncbi:MAG: hypothetical protein WBR35_21210 [Anaerolineae bacterium]